LEELDKFDLRLVYADREFAVDEVILLDFVITARYQMYKKYGDKLGDVDITYCGVTGFLCVRHVSGAYLVILRKGDGIIAFLVGLMLELLLFWLRRGGVFRMLFVR